VPFVPVFTVDSFLVVNSIEEIIVKASHQHILLVIIAVLGGISLIANLTGVKGLFQKTETKQEAQAKAARLKNIGALGRLEPFPKLLRISSPSSQVGGAVLGKLFVNEGDWVDQGTVLAHLDNYPVKAAALAESEAQQKISEAQLLKTKAGSKYEDIAAQEAVLQRNIFESQRLKDEFERVKGLYDKKAITEEVYESAKTALSSAEKQIEEARYRLASLQKVRDEDLAISEAEVARARMTVNRAKADMELAAIKAPITGRILKIYAREGESIGTDGFVEMGDTHKMCAVAEVYEADIPRVKIGQKATVKIESSSEVMEGHVIQLGYLIGRRIVLDNDPVKDTDAKIVEVWIQLEDKYLPKVENLSYTRVQVIIHTAPES
jgi:HlyD family secretion protein